MATKSKLKQKYQPNAQSEPPIDVFVVHEADKHNVKRSPADTELDISFVLPSDAEYIYHKVLLENKVAEVASRVAHEFNHPLATILVYTQLLLSRGTLDQITKESLETIYREAQQASLLTTSLFFYSRRDKPEKRPTSIQEVLQKTVELHVPRLRANNIEVIVKLQPDIPKTMADPYQMQQAFSNLIINAEQAMLEAHGKGTLCIKARQAVETIQITFDDDGPGILQKNLMHIFEPFFTTREVGKGLGLGLSICSAIVEGHGGHIYAISEPGKGASFFVELPIITP
jgi:two-component system NtrC family sensor kinase